jgi:hypothetical protein
MTRYDLIISGCSTSQSNTQFNIACSVWEIADYEHTIEFWTDASGRNKLYRSIKPGAVEELMDILGDKTFIDCTYSSSNTISIKPNNNATSSSISSMRYTYPNINGEYKIAIKSYREWIPEKNTFAIKLIGYEV